MSGPGAPIMPFTAEQFFAVFRAYNETVWPAQWFLAAAGALALVGALSRREERRG
ncbi:MAG: DUF6064 family protein [Myxococcota bacterium]